uniref:Uncharacterized protein n=1 Tax=Streptomyces avermitilis TaxID=33903 RepID=A0A499V2Y2_STRAX|nr:hypothetical protein SAVMC3_12530 [Streptomyces avermitilis]
MSHHIRLALAAILLVTFYAAVALTILIWVTLVILMFDVAGSVWATTLPVTGFLFCAGTAVPVYALGDAARRSLFLVDTPSTPSLEVGRGRAAALHALVDDLAERLGISEPVRIRLHTAVGPRRWTRTPGSWDCRPGTTSCPSAFPCWPPFRTVRSAPSWLMSSPICRCVTIASAPSLSVWKPA